MRRLSPMPLSKSKSLICQTTVALLVLVTVLCVLGAVGRQNKQAYKVSGAEGLSVPTEIGK
jgi:hypothetical protein